MILFISLQFSNNVYINYEFLRLICFFHSDLVQIVPKRDKEKLEKLTELVGEENNRCVNVYINFYLFHKILYF